MPVASLTLKNRSVIFLLIIFILVFSYENVFGSNKLKVSASIYPLAHFAERVGTDYVDVTNIMPPGVEPHEYEPTPGDIKKIYDSRIFLFSGAGLDTWAKRIRPELRKKGIVVIEMASYTDLKSEYQDVNYDPHIWLDPLLARKMTVIIRDIFVMADPDHADIYTTNCDLYTTELNRLHMNFKEGLNNCSLRELIVTHDAYNYLTRRYNLTAYPITGITPEEEPSPRKLAELSRLALDKNIKYIFFEKLLSPRLAKTIAREVDASTLELNPLGGITKEDIIQGKTYITIMEENLENLRTALGCE